MLRFQGQNLGSSQGSARLNVRRVQVLWKGYPETWTWFQFWKEMENNSINNPFIKVNLVLMIQNLEIRGLSLVKSDSNKSDDLNLKDHWFTELTTRDDLATKNKKKLSWPYMTLRLTFWSFLANFRKRQRLSRLRFQIWTISLKVDEVQNRPFDLFCSKDFILTKMG